MFDYHEEVGDNNWMFRALSRTTFGSPKYHAEVRAQVVAYMTARSDRFSAGQNDFESYLILLRDYQACGGQQELQAFAELYAVNINVYDRMTSSNPMYHISSWISTNQTISLFYNGNHYDSFLPRDTEEVLQLCKRKYKKVKVKEFLEKEEAKLIRRKVDKRFTNDFSTTTTDQYFKSIAKYWEDGSYSKIITDIKGKNKRKDSKRSFRRLVCKDRRLKIEKNEIGDLQLFKNLQYKKYEELKVAAFENKEGYSRNNEMTIEEEIDLVIEHTKQENLIWSNIRLERNSQGRI